MIKLKGAPAKDQLHHVLSNLDGEIVLINPQPDLDSLGATGAISVIAQTHYGLGARILLRGEMEHPQNDYASNRLPFLELMTPVDEFDPEEDSITNLVLADSNSTTDGRIPEGIREVLPDPVIVIDHHDGCVIDPSDENCIWVEKRVVGSASTLIAEFMKKFKIEFPEEFSYLYTLLALGIYTDTHDARNASARDLTALKDLKRKLDPDAFDKIVDYPLPPEYITYLNKATSYIYKEDGYAVTGIGFFKKYGDLISTIADDLVRVERINDMIVWGIREGTDIVRVSIRTHDAVNTLRDFTEFIQDRFGSGGGKVNPHGRGEGGTLITDINFGSLGEGMSQKSFEETVQKHIEDFVFKRKDAPSE